MNNHYEALNDFIQYKLVFGELDEEENDEE